MQTHLHVEKPKPKFEKHPPPKVEKAIITPAETRGPKKRSK